MRRMIGARIAQQGAYRDSNGRSQLGVQGSRLQRYLRDDDGVLTFGAWQNPTPQGIWMVVRIQTQTMMMVQVMTTFRRQLKQVSNRPCCRWGPTIQRECCGKVSSMTSVPQEVGMGKFSADSP